MLRHLLAILVVSAGVFAVGRADPPADPKTPAQIKEEAALREKLIAQRFREFETQLLQIAQRLERSDKPEDREKAKALKDAIEAASKSGITTRLDKLISLLRDSKANNLAEIKEAIDHGERIAKDMRTILDLLLQDGSLAQNQAFQRRLAELIKMLEALIRTQKVVRVHTEKGEMPMPELGQAQGKVTKNTEEFAKEMEDKTKPGADRLPGKELVRKANDDQRSAGTDIEGNKRDTASGHQTSAIVKLTEVRDALDKLLKQLRDEELKVILAGLQARCELMLQMQIEVRDGTVAVDKTVAASEDKKATRADIQKALQLSDREALIVAEADKAIQMIKAEGSAVAFLEVFQQLRQDMVNVHGRLGKTDVGVLTQRIEQDIIDTLKEMIDAVKLAQQPTPPMPTPPSPNPNDPRPPGDRKLIEKLAELKMIRSMQQKVYERTQIVGRRFDGEQPEDPTARADLRNLAERQQRIQQVTEDIARERNK